MSEGKRARILARRGDRRADSGVALWGGRMASRRGAHQYVHYLGMVYIQRVPSHS